MNKLCLVPLLILAGVAFAAGTTIPPSAPEASQPRTERFTPRNDTPGKFTLLGQRGDVGRTQAIGDDFPTQLRFAGDTTLLDCRIHLPHASDKVQPGETAVVVVKCSEPHRVYAQGLSFEAFENGRKIGEGTLRP